MPGFLSKASTSSPESSASMIPSVYGRMAFTPSYGIFLKCLSILHDIRLNSRFFSKDNTFIPRSESIIRTSFIFPSFDVAKIIVSLMVFLSRTLYRGTGRGSANPCKTSSAAAILYHAVYFLVYAFRQTLHPCSSSALCQSTPLKLMYPWPSDISRFSKEDPCCAYSMAMGLSSPVYGYIL